MNHITKYTLILLFILFAGCSPFKQKDFIEEAFDFNLKEAAAEKKTKEKNGLLIVYGVEKNDKILEQALINNGQIHTSFIAAYHNNQKLGNNNWGSTIAKQWKSFDGYVQMSIYYPRTKILLFGYFSYYGG